MLKNNIMRFRDLFFKKVEEEKRSYREEASLFNFNQLAGTTVNEKSALALSAVYSATNLISNHLALMPFDVLHIKNGKPQKETTSIQYHLLNKRSNSTQNAFNFRKVLLTSFLLRGNAYAKILRDKKTLKPYALIFLHPDLIKPYLSEKGVKYYKNVQTNETYTDFEILHFYNYSTDGIKGISPIKQHAENLGIGLNAQRFANDFYKKGANVGGVVEVPTTLEEDAFNRMQLELKNYTGSNNAHKLMLLEGGAKYNKIGVAPEDAQFLGTREFTTEEIARIYNIPNHKINNLNGATYSNVEQQNTDYVQSCLLPIAENFEQEFMFKLFFLNEQTEYKINQNFEQLLRGDITTRTAYYKTMFDTGAFSINDILRREGENEIKNGEYHFIAANNLSTLENAIKNTSNGQ